MSYQDRISKHSVIDGDCLRWMGAVRGNGRPAICIEGKSVTVGRLVLFLAGKLDSLDSPLQALHKEECKLKMSCVKLEHLYAGTHTDNMADVSNERTHCPHGHEYTKENIVMKKGSRECKQCAKDKRRSRRSGY
jgi:hypothetical protein